MLKRIAFIISLMLLLAPMPLSARRRPGEHVGKDLGRLLNAVAIDATKTFTLASGQAAGFGVMLLQVVHVNSAASAVTMTCDVSLDSGTTFVLLQSCSVAAGLCTSTDASWSKTVSANDSWAWRIDFLGAPDIRCNFDGTGADGSDTVTVLGRLITQ